jgi:serine/threonine kinase 32
MPFMPGGDLRYHLNRRPVLTEEGVRLYACELILALSKLHSLHIMLRDLKPDNILLDGNGHAHISDFGLAKIAKKEQKFMSHNYAGSRGYCAPEVANGEPYSFTADAFSLGVVLYEMMHGKLPYPKGAETYPHPPPFGDAMSNECRDFLSELLVEDPHYRFGGMADLSQPTLFWDHVRQHAWLADADWASITDKRTTPPIIPVAGIVHCSPRLQAEAVLLGSLETRQRAQTVIPEHETFDGWDFNTRVFFSGSGASSRKLSKDAVRHRASLLSEPSLT